ncbi:iron chelate uptake ABC transporter family permease subunit [Leisingera sp.]|uniref:iron chelate uptake ABC transporter family permease subunit n=1 Tax=Leisingera sp. TaxID=1879318 RepID=UPI002B26FE1F|nr:iron chelate uptake ABC transporter family permease subunit [Leisingera sp.]
MRFGLILLLLAMLALAYVLWGGAVPPEFILQRRLLRLGAMVAGGCCIALSSILFQTVARNRILTPAVMGYEAVYLLFQALLILAFGAESLRTLGAAGNMVLSVLVMLGWSVGLHVCLLRRRGTDISLLLLAGLVLTLVITSFTQFVQLRISPGEFAIFQSFAQMSFDGITGVQLALAAMAVCFPAALLVRRMAVLDVVAMGREQALSLGVDHGRETALILGLIALLTAASTSLIGPSVFMGVFVANIAYQLAGSHHHRRTLPIGCLIAVAAALLAELLVQHLFQFATSVGLLINLTCGIYFLLLILRKRSVS